MKIQDLSQRYEYRGTVVGDKTVTLSIDYNFHRDPASICEQKQAYATLLREAAAELEAELRGTAAAGQLRGAA